ncbi:hypothetical protein ACIBF1_19045 [Spirillospora sp. NPDC050679]
MDTSPVPASTSVAPRHLHLDDFLERLPKLLDHELVTFEWLGVERDLGREAQVTERFREWLTRSQIPLHPYAIEDCAHMADWYLADEDSTPELLAQAAALYAGWFVMDARCTHDSALAHALATDHWGTGADATDQALRQIHLCNRHWMSGAGPATRGLMEKYMVEWAHRIRYENSWRATPDSLPFEILLRNRVIMVGYRPALVAGLCDAEVNAFELWSRREPALGRLMQAAGDSIAIVNDLGCLPQFARDPDKADPNTVIRFTDPDLGVPAFTSYCDKLSNEIKSLYTTLTGSQTLTCRACAAKR